MPTRPPASGLEPFLVLPENRFAYTAVASLGDPQGPRSIYIYGASGVGKSHLARHAVRRFLARRPKARVQQLTGSEFAADFAEASVDKTIPLFQTAARQVDLLVVEDLHALAGRPETQQQLLALANDLHRDDCPIVWTSLCPSGELSGFSAKLISRFRSGVTAAIGMPSAESRRLLLEHYARGRQFALSPAAARLLAADSPVSPRELLSILLRLDALARHERTPVDSDLVRKFLERDVLPSRPRLDDICRAVARQFGISSADLRSRRRARRFVLPRQCAMYLARELTDKSLDAIGQFYGRRDHSTVMHACERIGERLLVESDLSFHVDQVRGALGAGPRSVDPSCR